MEFNFNESKKGTVFCSSRDTLLMTSTEENFTEIKLKMLLYKELTFGEEYADDIKIHEVLSSLYLQDFYTTPRKSSSDQDVCK